MVNFNSEPPPNVVRVPRWTLALHVVQFAFAIVILGLDAYGISYIAYNALIFSLVVCLCTLGVAMYLVASQLFIHKLYNAYIALAVHAWMLLFWVVALGLVANLARIWSGAGCSYYYGYGYSCSYYYKRDLEVRDVEKRDTTSYTAYYGALAAGAVFSAIQLVTWALSAIFLVLNFNKHRATVGANPHVAHAPPQYASAPLNGANISQPIPMEKYNETNVPTAGHSAPQDQYAQPTHSHQHQQQFAAPYPQEPVPRQSTVSPILQDAYPPPSHPSASELSSPQQHDGVYHPDASELSTPQHTGAAGRYDPNVSELSNSK